MVSESFQLKGRVAVVTGGSRGIGRAVVLRFAESGANVVVNYREDQSAADAAVIEAQRFGVEAMAVRADVSKLAEAEELIAKVLDHFHRIDFLICNAGIWKGAPTEAMSEELWDRTIGINLKGTWTTCRAVIPHMKQQRFGRIVIVSSTAGQRGEANFSNYAASKGGQISFTKSLAAELAPFGINVNCVAPGWVKTDLSAGVLSDKSSMNSILGTIPLGRVSTPNEIAWPIVFLCSDWASYISGEILNVNGGSVLCG